MQVLARLLLGEAPFLYARFYEVFEKLHPAPEVAARAVVVEIVFKHRDVVFAEKARRALRVFFLIYAVRLFVVFHLEHPPPSSCFMPWGYYMTKKRML